MLLNNRRGFPQPYKFNEIPIQIPKVVRKIQRCESSILKKNKEGGHIPPSISSSNS